MDMLKLAKDLIKQGETLNDPELITSGYNLLNKYSKEKTTKKIVKEEEDLSNVEIKLAPPIVKTDSNPITDEFSYICSNCKQKFTFGEKRKKCPNCKKHKLILCIEEKEEFTAQIFKKGKIPRGKVGEDGQIIERQARSEPINLSKIKHNRFIDDGQYCNDEENEQLKAKHKISPRVRAKFKYRKVTCTECGKTYNVAPIHAAGASSEGKLYKCDKCITRGIRG